MRTEVTQCMVASCGKGQVDLKHLYVGCKFQPVDWKKALL